MYTITLVQETHIPALATIMARVFTVSDPEKPWDEAHALEYLNYWFKKQPDMFFGAFDEHGNPVGAMAVNIKPWRTDIRANDGVIFVDIDHQQHGIAKMLMQKVLSEAMNKHNVTTVEAITFGGEEFPLTWYKKLGMKPDNHAVIIKGNCQEILDNLS